MQAAQQVILREAMRTLKLTREGLAGRLGVTRRALDTWLLPDESNEHRAMPTIVDRFVTEILGSANEAKYTQSVYSEPGHLFGEPGAHLISVDQFNRDSVEKLFRVADLLQPVARRQKVCRVLEGAVLANLFFEASTRTRLSFGAAFCRLGGSVCDTTGFTFSSMSPGEAIYDISRVVSGYVDVIVVRHPERGAVSEFARATNVPVINGGDGPGEHPSQALLDLYTIEQEFARLGKRIDGSRVALVGDLKNGRTVHSLLKLLAMYRNLSISLVSPHGLEMPATIVDAVDSTGSTVQVGNSLSDGLALADIVYATRVDRGQISTESLEGEQPEFRITRSMVDMFCKPETIVMHPLPRDSRPLANDLAMDLNADPRLAIFRQTDNGIPIRMAIFAVLLGVDEQIARSIRDATWRRPAYIGPDDASFSRL